MKKVLWPFVVSVIVILLLPVIPAKAGSWTVKLVAGQTMDAGTVTVTIEDGIIEVTFETKDGWVLDETHVYVGCVKPPTHSPGGLGSTHEDLGGVTTDTHTFSWVDIACECIEGSVTLYFATHAVVSHNTYGSQTAWGEGEEINGGWAMYFTITIPCNQVPELPLGTIMALGSTMVALILFARVTKFRASGVPLSP